MTLSAHPRLAPFNPPFCCLSFWSLFTPTHTLRSPQNHSRQSPWIFVCREAKCSELLFKVCFHIGPDEVSCRTYQRRRGLLYSSGWMSQSNKCTECHRRAGWLKLEHGDSYVFLPFHLFPCRDWIEAGRVKSPDETMPGDHRTIWPIDSWMAWPWEELVFRQIRDQILDPGICKILAKNKVAQGDGTRNSSKPEGSRDVVQGFGQCA